MTIRRVWCHRCHYPRDLRDHEKARPCCLCRCSVFDPIPPATLWAQQEPWDLMLTGEDRQFLRSLTAPTANP